MVISTGNHFPDLTEYRDPHIGAALLKEYLRALPVPLINFDAYDQLVLANCMFSLSLSVSVSLSLSLCVYVECC
jgi:hypothetical protein